MSPQGMTNPGRKPGESETQRHGVTLLELIVALALLAVILGVSGLALASLQPTSQAEAERRLRQARADAIRGGAPVRAESVLFLPDGTAVGAGVDPLIGAPRARR